jgi:hypothetical protein
VVACERSDGPAPDPARRNCTRDNRELVRMFDLSEDSATASALSRQAARYRLGCVPRRLPRIHRAGSGDAGRLWIDNRAPGRATPPGAARRAAGSAGLQHGNHMNVLINNLTGVTSTSAGQHRPDGRPVRAHDELDHHAIGWRVGPSAVRPGPGDPFTWSVSVIQGWISRPMGRKILAGIEQVSVHPSVLLPSPTRSRP